ncbi:MAG TPA: hypothetical protein VFP58_12120 [Candidatus Eisenbacteria bacterium]|nr:hypothetical protein [Candidatus Eisenbacteria bacterium]
MPGFLLHFGAQVQCLHAGQAQPTSVNPRVLVSGQPIVMQTSSYVVAGCTLPPPTAANGPCVSAQWVSASLRVKANGIPVLLQDSQATCVPSGTPLLVLVTQTRALGQ